ncbi:cupin domain-containing protein [Halomicrobium katesii]|uniref:cupin domain-containing protein n=1 Tax=Halomicrobium katesii TaxID=437163 RepID=UPI000381BBB9|nr:cupin domain-containing protein [Halomicrobium katesii]
MERISIDDVEARIGPAAVKRALGPALETAEVALNYYELAPGDSFGFGYHRHSDQEEVFYVFQGTATFETEDGPVAVGPDEVIRFAPGEWQLGRNAGDERVVALAVGAPEASGDTEMVRACPDCGERTEQTVDWADDALVTLCVDCGARTGRFEYSSH